MKLTMLDLKAVFLDVIKGKKSFDEASDWASAVMRKDEVGELEVFPRKDLSSFFSGLTYLLGLDLKSSPTEYLHSIDDVIDKFHRLFGDLEK